MLTLRQQKLKKKLEAIKKQRNLIRHDRAKRKLPVVSVVGYTNAGIKGGIVSYHFLLGTRPWLLNKHEKHQNVCDWLMNRDDAICLVVYLQLSSTLISFEWSYARSNENSGPFMRVVTYKLSQRTL